MATMTIGEFLISRLKALGITEILGVPGDFNLSFLEQISEAENFRFVGTCNELNAAYAADGYARLHGIGALLTTYGVGELSALNGIAGARAEHVPVISLAGAPPQYATEYRWNLHHSLADGNYDNMLDAFRPFTEVAIRVSPMNVVEEVDRALRSCVREKRPVHIQIPSDITHLEVEVPDEPFTVTLPSSDGERRKAAVESFLHAFDKAKKPVLLLDQDTNRHGFTELFRRIIDRAQIPFAHMSSGKAQLNERHPLCIGTYNGAASAPGVQDVVEGSDFLITTNPRFIEVNSGNFTHSLPEANVINFGDQHMKMGEDFYVGINSLEVLEDIAASLPEKKATDAPAHPAPEYSVTASAPLTQARLWPRMANFIREDDVVVAEAGTSNIGLGPQRMPNGVTYINSPIWGSIGFTLPALMGAMFAAPQRRHLLFIGDGSFQLTAQELSTILREDLAPIIFLINNRGYTIERFILGMEQEYNDIQNWQFGALPRVFKSDTSMKSYHARTEGELEEVLAELEEADHGAFVELHLDPFDAPKALQAFGPATATFDFGPRGPRNPEN
ncbi:alpha-keto acid decarboxylase family protein [Corynebacterium mayonis]|uniref:alpha-keto acid decarboxylase family protein n=1 Tax=Corynebacterium mayonis TaxID=3062461 RepID=UPI0031404CA6